MLTYPNFDPIAFHIGPLAVRWYGLMYLIGFTIAFFLARYRIRTQPHYGVSKDDLDDLIFYAVLGTVLGGRLGYVLFYKPEYYFAHPSEILAVWQGGMSFHGGFLGVIFAIWLFSFKRKKSWLQLTDFAAPCVPLAIGAGRLGNFINGELWGKVTNLPWGMVFPGADDQIRHPSQLYEFALEGLTLFVILWVYSRKPRPRGAISALFLIGYGVLRFIAEFTREPDNFLGPLALGFSMGQWLSLPMVILGVGLMIWAYKKRL